MGGGDGQAGMQGHHQQQAGARADGAHPFSASWHDRSPTKYVCARSIICLNLQSWTFSFSASRYARTTKCRGSRLAPPAARLATGICRASAPRKLRDLQRTPAPWSVAAAQGDEVAITITVGFASAISETAKQAIYFMSEGKASLNAPMGRVGVRLLITSPGGAPARPARSGSAGPGEAQGLGTGLSLQPPMGRHNHRNSQCAEWERESEVRQSSAKQQQQAESNRGGRCQSSRNTGSSGSLWVPYERMENWEGASRLGLLCVQNCGGRGDTRGHTPAEELSWPGQPSVCAPRGPWRPSSLSGTPSHIQGLDEWIDG